jgi:hypothetical protein
MYSFLAELICSTSSTSTLPLPPVGISLEDGAVLGKVILMYNKFASFIMQNSLESASLMRHLLDGNAMMGLFGLKKKEGFS